MDDLKEKLIQAYNDGSFFEFINEIYYQDRKGEKLLPNLLTDLHNNGKLDLVELFNLFVAFLFTISTALNPLFISQGILLWALAGNMPCP